MVLGRWVEGANEVEGPALKWPRGRYAVEFDRRSVDSAPIDLACLAPTPKEVALPFMVG